MAPPPLLTFTLVLFLCSASAWLLVDARLTWQADQFLVGYGCAGTEGILYAKAEDDFPECEIIE
jgi:hypothetical protein